MGSLVINKSAHVFTEATYEDWTRSDRYQNSFLLSKDNELNDVLEYSAARGLRDISVTPAQGKYLNLLAKSLGVKRYLEVGTLGGYSTIWVARALPPGGKAVTLEISEEVAQVAQENFRRAGVSERISLLLGPAAETLKTLSSDEPFDLAFIDADKANVAVYFKEAKRLVRKGGVIIVDNVIRFGRVCNLDYTDAEVDSIRAVLKAIQSDDEVEATTISTVGEKGYDGFLYAVIKS